MTDTPRTPSRPGQTTLAGWLIIVGSVALVLLAFDRVSGLHTLEVREELEAMLSEPPLSGTGWSVSTLAETLRILAMVAAGAATASAILGFHALRKSASARLVLTLLAPLIVVGGFATAGFFAPMVVAGVVMLWLQPTRDWFAGRAITPSSASRAFAPGPSQSRPPERPPASYTPGQLPPPAATPFGAPHPHPATQHAVVGPPRPGTVSRRPGAVVAAAVLTWVFAGLVLVVMAASLVMVAAMPDEVFRIAEEQGQSLEGLSRNEVVGALLVMCSLGVIWCLAAIVFAVFVVIGAAWARLALLICAAAAAAFLLLMALSAPFVVVAVAGAATTCALLMRPEVRAWFGTRR